LTDNSQEASPPQILTDGPIPVISITKGTVSTTGDRGVSDIYYEKTGKVPYYGRLRDGITMDGLFNAPTDTTDNQATSATPDAPTTEAKSMASDAMDWYGMNLPKVPTTTTSTAGSDANGDGMALVKVEEAGHAPTHTELINNIPVPKLRTASDNPLSMMGADIEESSIDPEASRIAVILKFQLKASNYATIVLRELMGTTVEELAL
jgi:tRNA pseudouridine13 synthase